jgi:hypothetical protein
MLIILASRLQDDAREVQLSAMLERMKASAVQQSSATTTSPTGVNSPSPMECTVMSLLLESLQLDSLSQLVSDTLCCSLFKSLSLSTFLLEQTGGSPLFVTQILQALHRDGLLRFSFELEPEDESDIPVGRETYTIDTQTRANAGEGGVERAQRYHREWQYDIAEIRRYFGYGSLGDALPMASSNSSASAAVSTIQPAAPSMLLFLQRHVAQLSEFSRLVLQHASCIGFEFSLLLLCQLLHDAQLPCTAADVRNALAQPIKEEIIVFHRKNKADSGDPFHMSVSQQREVEIPSRRSSGASTPQRDTPTAAAARAVALNAAVAQLRQNTSPMGQKSNQDGGHLTISEDTRGAVVEDELYNQTMQTAVHDATQTNSADAAHTGELDLTVLQQEVAGVSCAFAHDKLHEAIYGQISDDKRTSIHLRIAQILLRQDDDTVERARLHTLAVSQKQVEMKLVVHTPGGSTNGLNTDSLALPAAAAGVSTGHATATATSTGLSSSLLSLDASGVTAAASALHLSEHHYFSIASQIQLLHGGSGMLFTTHCLMSVSLVAVIS